MAKTNYIVVQHPGGMFDYPKDLELPRLGEKLTFWEPNHASIIHNATVKDIVRTIWVKDYKRKIKSTMTEIKIVVGENNVS